jgi:hypothetical protein
MKTSLVQRGKFSDRNWKKGIDSIVEFDYMGSSEFEYGALPESLNKIRENISEYAYLDVPLKGKVISVCCKDSQKSEILTYLTELSDSKFRLQEYSDFDTYINPSQYFKSNTDFWWDIQNNLMFWRKNQEFETKFKSIIENKSI